MYSGNARLAFWNGLSVSMTVALQHADKQTATHA
jgi:hypothetical protein